MDHQSEKQSENVEQSTVESDQSRAEAEARGDEGELKITVRKLEMPVRPRGVLAE